MQRQMTTARDASTFGRRTTDDAIGAHLSTTMTTDMTHTTVVKPYSPTIVSAAIGTVLDR